jgi:uncharacterized membrane protein
MLHTKKSYSSSTETSRIEAFSDGVYAIAITLLILELKTPSHQELQNGLFEALIKKWHAYLSFFIGFFTVLVCWINHHFLFNRIHRTTQTLIMANSFTLLLVTFIPFPTAVLAGSFIEGVTGTAIRFYGLTYILIPLSYLFLSYCVNNDPSIDYTEDTVRFKKAAQLMYIFATLYTLVAFAISFFNVNISLTLYFLLFFVFLFPQYFTNIIRLKTKAMKNKN